MGIIDIKMLTMFDTKGNNNKFYKVTLLDNGDIDVTYGRIGTDGQKTSYSGGKRKFDSLVASKLKKGYREAQIESISNSDGSSVSAKKVIDIALEQIIYKDAQSRTLIEEIAKENIHNITSNTNITYDSNDGLFKTPLGVVKKEAVEKAYHILDKIEALLNADPVKNENKIFELNEDYFYLIPNKVKNARDKNYLLFNKSNIETQRVICNQLFDTLDLIEDLKKGKKELDKEAEKQDVPKVFDVEIEHILDKALFDKISQYYNKSKNSMHGHRIMQSKVSKIYKVKLGSQQEGFEKAEKEIGNVELLWHGTRVANILSIMGKGLLMPSVSPGQKAGAMFGNGLYFANQSSKSLQYCDGLYWASGSHSRNKIYMFLASVAMGKYYVPNGPTGSSGKPPAGYDSFFAKAGKSGVQNDEIIIFKGNQIRLDYLVEIEI